MRHEKESSGPTHDGAVLMVATIADAQQVPDPRVADLIRAGKVRVGLFPPQYTKDPVTGELRSVWVEIARALAARIGVQVRASRPALALDFGYFRRRARLDSSVFREA